MGRISPSETSPGTRWHPPLACGSQLVEKAGRPILMAHEVVERVTALAPQLAAASDETEQLGKLSDEAVKVIRAAGVMRMLAPPEHGGYAAHPRDFAEAVMEVAKSCGSAGWVCGV